MSKFLNRVLKYIGENNMISPQDRIVVGLSGGADSVCLLMVLYRLRERLGLAQDALVAVHINHMIRGQEADLDEEFARKLCQDLNITFEAFKKDIPAYARENKLSEEEAGRSYRYESFRKVMENRGMDKIAVAHNKNDLAETVIFHMLRGSGLKGMSGISPVRDQIIRPLLDVNREDIEAYLEDIGQEYRNDSTNETLDYQRNRIRHVILPAMNQINSGGIEHICQMANEAKASYEFIYQQALKAYEACREPKAEAGTVTLNISQFCKYNEILQEHIIHEALGQVAGKKKDITRKHIACVVGLTSQETGNWVRLPYGIIARKNYDELILGIEQEKSLGFNIDIVESGSYTLPDGCVIEASICEKSAPLEVSKKIYTKVADYGKIDDAICIRTPQEGDYIVIDSAGKTKKLSRVFIDNKIDREERRLWPVVASGHEIIWVVGLRYSEKYKVTQETTRVIHLKYIGKGDI